MSEELEQTARIAYLETALRAVHAGLRRIISDLSIEERLVAEALGLPQEGLSRAKRRKKKPASQQDVHVTSQESSLFDTQAEVSDGRSNEPDARP